MGLYTFSADNISAHSAVSKSCYYITFETSDVFATISIVPQRIGGVCFSGLERLKMSMGAEGAKIEAP